MYQLKYLKNINIGYKGQNISRTVQINVAPLLQKHPGCSIRLLVQPDGKKDIYIADTTIQNGILTWLIKHNPFTSEDGYASAVIVASIGQVIKKTHVFRLYCGKTIQGDQTDPPDAIQSWQDAVTSIIGKADVQINKIQSLLTQIKIAYESGQLNGPQGDKGNSPVITGIKDGDTLTILSDNKVIGYIKDGKQGQAPKITAIKNGSQMIIKAGDQIIGTLRDGVKGDKGDSPVITGVRTGNVVSIEADGKTIGTISDGYTPVKGKDYFDGEKGDNGVVIQSTQPTKGSPVWINPDSSNIVEVPDMQEFDALKERVEVLEDGNEVYELILSKTLDTDSSLDLSLPVDCTELLVCIKQNGGNVSGGAVTAYHVSNSGGKESVTTQIMYCSSGSGTRYASGHIYKEHGMWTSDWSDFSSNSSIAGGIKGGSSHLGYASVIPGKAVDYPAIYKVRCSPAVVFPASTEINIYGVKA